ncbi:hypothetical protein UFOVP952_25 [uncultured Caudovirales phage]|uniref:Uncharacterized protein n=1 Tax=uncultured Caudovirales phage TaxID=2100421 RepID=A0A6J7XP75_9CAUD|nr:hypothetical protein UFOVP952_25 [uncultured Caudovirales phage]CAB4203969.1 hypothetical protein UFOVP1392_15 [uncultured Caudovirales phage]CAB5229777.1 hypothetical protein UFOVP1569_14 [uncultured Caudovirales phage]
MSLLLLLQREYADSPISDAAEEVAGVGTAPQEWTFILADKNGTQLDILDPAVTACELNYQRSQPTTCTFTLQGEDDRAYNIISALTTTRPLAYAYRDGRLYFAGYLSGVKEAADEDLSMMVTFTDALGVLAHRLTDSDFEVYDETTTNLIAGTVSGGTSLVAQANATAATGLTATAATTGFDVETFTTSRDVVLDKIMELVNLTNGPDLRITPVAGSSTFGTLEVGTLYQGTTVMARFGYGSSTVGNLTGFDWEITPPATRVICVGNEVEGSSTVNAAVTTAETRIGVWQSSINNNDLYLENDCIDAANAATRLDWQTVVSFTPEPAITPRPLRDYTIGDVVSVRASRGSLLYNGQLRVRSITLSIDDSGFEVAHRIECEAGGPGTSQQQGVGGGSADTVSVSNGLLGGFV